jgi:putative PIN family toxin of toxin-antitoxin system
MTIEPRTVFDTGVVVSAILLPRSIPRRAFDLATVSGRMLASQSTIDELEEVLRRPKFNKYVSEQARLEFLAALVSEAEIVPITQNLAACRDSKDDKFLELAISGHASHIVSGDADLLVLHPFRGLAILRPDEFLFAFKD